MRLWRRTSLVQRLVMVALAPTLFTAIVLVAIVTRHQMGELRSMAQNTADAIAIQAAAVSADPLQRMARRELNELCQLVVRLPHVAQLQIRSSAGEIVADCKRERLDSPSNLIVTRPIISPDAPTLELGSVKVNVSIADAIDAQRDSLRNALLALVLSLIIAGGIALQTARWISAPLQRLAGAVARLGHGDRDVVVAVTDNTEIGEVQRGFNAAVAALRDAQQGMEQEIEQATLSLARKNAALEAASVAKARFLAAASHDLRQPLYALTLFSSGLAVDEHDPTRLERIGHIQECVAALDRLFSELLDLSRLETGAMQVEITEFPLDHLLDEISRNFRLIAEQQELRLVVRPTELWVRTDRTMLGRILNNLVSNALRYTESGGVLVGARRCGKGRLRVDVWDTGSGIAPEHQPHVFDEFYRVDQQRPSDTGAGHQRGLGLGLATVTRLAQLLDTEVTLASEPGRGSVFSLRLASVRAQPSSRTRANEAPVDMSGMRVLVVDDEPAILSGVRYLLKSWGCAVLTAENREQAFAAAATWPIAPDLIISDLHLGQGDNGLDLLQALDLHYTENQLPTFARLLITGETRGERLREIRAAKLRVLYKPVSPERLRNELATVWLTSRRKAELAASGGRPFIAR